MTKIIWLSLLTLLANTASAQRGGFGRGGFGGGGFGRGGGRSGFAQGGFRPPVRSPGGFVNRGFGFNRGLSGSPYGFGGFGYSGEFVPYDAGVESGFSPQPGTIIIPQPPPPQVSIQQPPREVHAVIHDYQPPAPSTATPARGEPLTFGIVLKDGSTRSAMAVVVDDNVLKYIDPEERNLQVPLDQVDREATRKLNRERNLSFWLPATP